MRIYTLLWKYKYINSKIPRDHINCDQEGNTEKGSPRYVGGDY